MCITYQRLLVFCLLFVAINPQKYDPYRPSFHFVPNPPNWMNDPNGPFYDSNTGMYHLFFQYQTPRVWGHAISTDLLHWENLPIAITNNETYDSGGVFTGSTTVVNGVPIIMYVNSNENKWCLSYPNNTNDINLTQWTDFAGNCVLNAPQQCPEGWDGAPTTAWTMDGKTWIFAYPISTGTNAAAVTYQTQNWINFTSASTQYLTYSNNTGAWDCIDFFELPNSQAQNSKLIASNITHVIKASYENMIYAGGDRWGLGSYDAESVEFIPMNNETHNEMWSCDDCKFDIGRYYSSKSFYDSKHDRQVIFGWINEQRTPRCSATPAPGQWCGMQSLPREIKVLSASESPTGKARIITYPIKEFEEIRIESSKYQINEAIILKQSDIIMFNESDISGAALDIEMSWKTGGDCAIWIAVNDNMQNKTRIGVNFNNVPSAKTVYIDTSTNGVGGSLVEGVVGWNGNDSISLRVIVDHSVVTVFVNNGITVATRRFYSQYNGTFRVGVAMFDHGNAADLQCILSDFTSWNVQTVIET